MIGVELNQTGQEGSRGAIQSTQMPSVCSLCWTTLFREQILCSEYLLVLNSSHCAPMHTTFASDCYNTTQMFDQLPLCTEMEGFDASNNNVFSICSMLEKLH